nr:MAG TPA: hypothetical protein [Caudoviricetes sp.]
MLTITFMKEIILSCVLMTLTPVKLFSKFL